MPGRRTRVSRGTPGPRMELSYRSDEVDREHHDKITSVIGVSWMQAAIMFGSYHARWSAIREG